MLPATIAADIKRQVLHYLEATFAFRDPNIQDALNYSLQQIGHTACKQSGSLTSGVLFREWSRCSMSNVLFTSQVRPYPGFSARDHRVSGQEVSNDR